MGRPIRHALLICVVALAAVPAFATQVTCYTSNGEQFHYTWRLRGGIRFIAGLLFPTSGIGNLRTTYAPGEGHSLHSELVITAPEGRQRGFYEYGSDIDERGAKTLTTTNGYAWGKKTRSEHTIFDYVKGLARIHKQTPKAIEDRVKKLPEGDGELRDVLSAIYYLRQNALKITRPVQTTIYTEGRDYPVIFQPAENRNFVVEGRSTPTLGFEIVDAPGGRNWPGGVKVWLTKDDRRIPVRIEIRQSIASMQLDLKAIESCSDRVGK